MEHIELDSTEMEMCRNFADACVHTNIDCYKKRNQYNLDKIKKDIEEGKRAEIAVYLAIRGKLGVICKRPDFKIYNKRGKDYSADLQTQHYNIHVKSTREPNVKKMSWVFQKNDPLVLNPELNDIIYFTKVDGYRVQIIHKAFAHKLLYNYKPPRIQSLEETKTCLYATDIL